MVNKNLNREKIIERISYFRTKKNISAYKLSAELGHAKNYFYRVESGKFDLSLTSFLEVLEMLDIPILELFFPELSESQLKRIEEIINEKK